MRRAAGLLFALAAVTGLALAARRGCRPAGPHELAPVAVASPLTELPPEREPIGALAISPDGALLAAAAGPRVRLVALPGGQPGAVLEGHRDRVAWAAFAPGGKTLLTASEDRTLRVWSLPDGKLSLTIAAPSPILAAALSPDGKRLAAGGTGGRVRLWSLPEGKYLGALSGHDGALLAAAFSPDGKLLATAGGDRVARLWKWPEEKALVTLAHHEDQVRALAWSPDGSVLATAGADGRLLLWSAPAGRLLMELDRLTAEFGDPAPASTLELSALTFSPDQKLLIAGAAKGGVFCLETRTGRLLQHLPDPAADPVRLALAGSGQLLAATRDGRRVALWRIALPAGKR